MHYFTADDCLTEKTLAKNSHCTLEYTIPATGVTGGIYQLQVAGKNVDNKDDVLSITIDSQTYTYVRCWYKLKNNHNETKTNYEWAKDNGKDYELHGHWWSYFNIVSNMFYTQTNGKTIKNICLKTLQDKNISADRYLQASAADNSFSYNYEIWSELNSSPPPYTFAKVNRVISFGDSLSDNGIIYNASQWLIPNKNSWLLGRFSNGLQWQEYIAEDNDLPLNNWAVGAASSSVKDYGILPGVLAQIKSWEEYMTLDKGYNAGNTLFTILIGANDFMSDGMSAAEVIANVKMAINTLIADGVRYIIIANAPDYSLVPAYTQLGRAGAVEVAQKVKLYNEALQAFIANMQQSEAKVHIILVDTYTFLDKILTKTSHYHFSNTQQSCLKIDTLSDINWFVSHPLRTNCTDSDTFVFWDTVHPTTMVHQDLAKDVESLIKAQWQPNSSTKG